MDDLAGHWAGAYIDSRYEDSVFPIRAKLELSGTRIRGRMIDERTEPRQSVESVLRGVPMYSPDRPYWEQFAQCFPDAVATSRLAVEARLEGVIDGRSIRFNQYYLKPQEVTWSASELKAVTQTLKPHTVVYEGKLSADGKEIRGTWSVIEPSDEGSLKRAAVSGEFWLKKRSDLDRTELTFLAKYRRNNVIRKS